MNFSARGLVGGGSATLDQRFPSLDPNLEWGRGFPFGSDISIPNEIDHFFPGLRGRRGGIDYGNLYEEARRRFDAQDFDRLFGSRSSSFFIAEPEVDVNVNISETFRLSFGGGYRFIGGAGALSDRLEGFTANVALKMSFF